MPWLFETALSSTKSRATAARYFPKISTRASAGARLHTLSYMDLRRKRTSCPRLAVPIAGDDPKAVQVAAGLVRDAGFDSPSEVGKLLMRAGFSSARQEYGPERGAAELRHKLSAGAMTALVGGGGAVVLRFYSLALLAATMSLRPLARPMCIAGGVKNRRGSLPPRFSACCRAATLRLAGGETCRGSVYPHRYISSSPHGFCSGVACLRRRKLIVARFFLSGQLFNCVRGSGVSGSGHANLYTG